MKRAARLALVVAVTAGATVAGARLLDGEPAVVDRGPVYPASWSRPQTPKPIPTDPAPSPMPEPVATTQSAPPGPDGWRWAR